VLLEAEAIGADAAGLGQLERDPLDDDREREDRERLAELALRAAHDLRARALNRERGRLAPPARRPAAVEDDERVLRVERHARPVEELLRRQALGRDVRRLADLQGALLRGPPVRAR